MEVHHRVHFDSEDPEGADNFGKDNTIVVQAGPKKQEIIAHLGFLQVNHDYEISFEIPGKLITRSLSSTDEETACISQDYLNSQVGGIVQDVPNVHCFLLDAATVTGANGEYNCPDVAVKVQLIAHKVKLMREKIQLRYPCGLLLTLHLNARVLGKGMGTPMLKNGIKCVGMEQDESDASDWPGFQ